MNIISKILNSIKDKLDKLPYTSNILLIGLTATTSGMMFGFDVSSISSFVSQESYLEFFGYPNSTQQGAITASMSAGSLIGGLLANHISEPYGRKMALLFCSFFWIIGAVIQCSCRDLAQLICGRVISGFGVGIGSTTAPVYCSEVSPRSSRGVMGGLYQMSITLGILVMFYIGYGCSFIDGVGSFRLAWALQMIPGVCLMIGVLTLPESPRWLANHNEFERAEIILRELNKKEDESKLSTELLELKESIIFFKLSKDTTYRDLFSKKNIKSSFVGISAQIWNQLTGMNVMMYYVVYIFEMVGYTGNTNLVSSSIQYVINFAITALALPLPDHAGRRILMVGGGVLMMMWLFLVGGLFAKFSEPIPHSDDATVVIVVKNKAAGKAIVACSYLFVATFASTWAVTSWTYVAEIFPTRTRAKGTSVAIACNWAFNFALAMFTPSAFSNITWKTYFVFGTFCGAMSINAFFFYPETRKKTLEEVDMIFQSKTPAWKMASFVPNTVGWVFSDEGEAPKNKIITEHHEFITEVKSLHN